MNIGITNDYYTAQKQVKGCERPHRFNCIFAINIIRMKHSSLCNNVCKLRRSIEIVEKITLSSRM